MTFTNFVEEAVHTVFETFPEVSTISWDGDEVVWVLDTGEEMVAREFRAGTRARQLFTKLEIALQYKPAVVFNKS